jgi:hypothetical protein
MSNPALLEKVRRQMAALDDGAFEAMSSRGLLRRARKDLEGGVKVEVAGEADAALKLCVGEWEVTLPESGPAQSRCSCPATGICQHILAACCWLRDQPAAEAEAPSGETVAAGADLLAITPDAMEKWGGRSTLRAAFGLAAQAAADVTDGDVVTVNFRFLNATCRFVPGGGLDGAIVTGPPKDAARLVLAALIVFQKSRGTTWPDASDGAVAVLAESSGAPRSREEVLASAIGLLCETARAGLVHATPATCERFATLSVSALAVNLPRLSLALRGLSQEFRLAGAREASADASRTFSAMARTYALCVALDHAGPSAPAALVGAHRTAYGEVGHLDLVGLAAWPWETASGYHGLTVLFWDMGARSWNTWTEARPRHIDPGYNPIARFTAGGPWSGADSPQILSRSRFRLLNARRNPAGRLSASSRTSALVTGPSQPHDLPLPVATDWAVLAEEAARATPIGLAETNPLDLVRVVRPAKWDQHFFDQTTQTFHWPLYDGNDACLRLQIRFSPGEEAAIRTLEALDPATLSGSCVIGRIARSAQGLTLHPFSMLWPDGRIRHLVFDAEAVRYFVNSPPANREAEDEPEDAEADTEEETMDETDLQDTPLARLLASMEDRLTMLGEGGASALHAASRDALMAMVKRALSVGWQSLPASLTRLAGHPTLDPGLLLRCRHECHLSRQALEADWTTAK